MSYQYLGDTRLARASSTAEGTYELGYDALGRCVRRVTNGVATYYAYDGERPIIEYNASGAITARNTYGIGIDEILARDAGALFYNQDRLGNISAVTDAEGKVVEQYRYDAFGQPEIRSAPVSGNPNGSVLTGTLVNNRFLFTGREWVPRYGFYEYRNRAYHPGLGRFMSEDPLGFKAGDRNLFRYCAGDPVNRTDPTGLYSDTLASGLRENNLTSTGGGDWNWFNGGVAMAQMQQQQAAGNDNKAFYGGVSGFAREQGLGKVDPKAVGKAVTNDAREDVHEETRDTRRGANGLRYAVERSTAEYVRDGQLVKSGPQIGENHQYSPQGYIPDPPKGSGINPKNLLTGTHGHGPGSHKTFEKLDIPSANGRYGRSYISGVSSVIDNGGRVHIYVPFGSTRRFYSDDGRNFHVDDER